MTPKQPTVPGPSRSAPAASIRRMRKPAAPSFIADVIADVVDDKAALAGLIAGAVALVAAGLDPKVWGPALPSVQAAVREYPRLEAVTLVLAVAGSALLLLGGAIGDSTRARPIILGGLAVELFASLFGLIITTGPLFVASRFVGHAAAAFVIPVSIALVATSYRGVARATAIGMAYGAYGAAGAAAPILLQILPGERWPALLVAAVACAAAIWIARDRIRDLPRPGKPERPYVVGTAIWAFGVISVTVGVVWFGSGWDNPVRWALIGVGAVVLGIALVHDRWRRRRSVGAPRIDRRPVAVAVFVGVVLAIAQTAPMLELPLYFHLVLGYGPLAAMVALGPLFIALVVAGPVAGILLARFTPRWLVGVGAIIVGLGNLLLALLATPNAGYVSFILPCLLVGAGFVIATTVRTAIIFASVPRGLPATAAALNEASISVGSRIGIVLVTGVVAQVAIASYTSAVAGLPAAEAERAIAAFRDILIAIGTPSFEEVASVINQADLQPYLDAYASGLRAALLGAGVIAIFGGVIALLALGRQDPLATVWEHSDERSKVTADGGA
jgi:MFS family permease